MKSHPTNFNKNVLNFLWIVNTGYSLSYQVPRGCIVCIIIDCKQMRHCNSSYHLHWLNLELFPTNAKRLLFNKHFFTDQSVHFFATQHIKLCAANNKASRDVKLKFIGVSCWYSSKNIFRSLSREHLCIIC